MSVHNNGLAFINPIYNAFTYARRAALSFFKYTPPDLNPVCINVDDFSPNYAQQDWDHWHHGMPAERCVFHHFEQNDGLTRSWNWGLQKARELGCRYAIAGNSDVLFTPGWYEGLLHHVERDAKLVGPVTNAPGWSQRKKQKQNVRNFFPRYNHNQDEAAYLAKVANYLKEHQPIERITVIDINGFFMLAKLDVWWEGAFDTECVFNPAMKMVHNENELQGRWRELGWQIGFVPSSFIYHYRAVSRGDKYKHTGWSRLDNPLKEV